MSMQVCRAETLRATRVRGAALRETDTSERGKGAQRSEHIALGKETRPSATAPSLSRRRAVALARQTASRVRALPQRTNCGMTSAGQAAPLRAHTLAVCGQRTIWPNSADLYSSRIADVEWVQFADVRECTGNYRVKVFVPYDRSGFLAVDGTQKFIDLNDLLLLNSGASLAQIDIETAAPLQGIAITLTQPTLHDYKRVCVHFDSESSATRLINPVERLAVHRLHWALRAQVHKSIVEMYLVDVLRTLFRQPTGPKPRRNVVDCARVALRGRESQRTTLTQVAEAIGVTPHYLTREFTRVTGISFLTYQMRLRLYHALVALPDCENIAELALSLGFSNHSHFSQTFKSAFGLTPSALRSSISLLPKSNSLRPARNV